MADNLDKQTCEACGADIRANALFCYNCGSQVGTDEAVQAEIENEKKVSNAWFKEELTEPAAIAKDTPTKQKVNPKIKEKVEVTEKTKSQNGSNKTDISKENSIKLTTAAAIKDRSKLGGRKTVEIEWDTPKSAPNIWFIIVSLILAAFAAFILFAMLYIR